MEIVLRGVKCGFCRRQGENQPAMTRIPKDLNSRKSRKQFTELATAYKPNFISYKKKRTMSLIDEFNAAAQSLDRILEKMDEADPADKETLEAYVKSMQVKVQQILKAILRVH